MQVVIPEGMVSGSLFPVVAPNGQRFEAMVPLGAAPGSTISVMVPVPVVVPQGYSSMPGTATAPRSKHRKALAKLLGDETCWCLVCPLWCGGCGCANFDDPICLGDWKCLCWESEWRTEDINNGQGCCYNFAKLCCCVSHCACPPGGGRNDGVPLFACCNQRCGGEQEGGQLVDDENARSMRDACLCVYCICVGFGVASCDDPLYKQSSKFLCCLSHAGCADCCPGDRDCIYSHSKACCCVQICSFPPCGGKTDGTPMLAVCGQVLAGPPIREPEQQAMLS